MYRLPKYSRSTSVTWSAYSDIECSRLFLYYWLLIRRTNPLVTWFPPVVYSAAREVAGFTSLLLKEMTLRGYNVGLWGFECWRIWITVSRFLALVFHYSSWCVCVCEEFFIVIFLKATCWTCVLLSTAWPGFIPPRVSGHRMVWFGRALVLNLYPATVF